MSGRQSLYGQSLVRNANLLLGSETQDKHWTRDWFTPVKTSAKSTSVTPSSTPAPFSDDSISGSLSHTEQRFNFRVKVWQLDADYRPLDDGDQDDKLDWDKFSNVKKIQSSGLTNDAIRGAVGTGDSIPGLSKTEDSAPKEEVKVEDVKEDGSAGLETTTISGHNKKEIPEELDKRDAEGDVLIE